MKVLIFSAIDGHWGGSEELWFDMVKAGAAQDCQFMVSHRNELKPPLENFPETIRSSVQFFTRRDFVLPSSPSKHSIFIKIFFKIMREVEIRKHRSVVKGLDPDVVLFNLSDSYTHLTDSGMRNYIEGIDRPYVILVQLNTPYLLLADSMRVQAAQTFRKAQKILFVSRQNLLDAERELATHFSNAHIVQNPIGFELKDHLPPKFPDTSTYNFASVARFDTAHKGQDILLEVLSQQVWRDRNWKLNFYGSGPGLQYLKSLTKFFDLEDKVIFKGFVRDAREIWEENHILLMASRKEGLPIVLVEASICARAAVVTDVGGNAEWIKDGETGFVAAAPTKNSFSEALERAWEKREEWGAMGQKNYQYSIINIDRKPGETLLNVLSLACGEIS